MRTRMISTSRSRRPRRPGSGGFTIVELMIATIIFGMVMLLCMIAVIQVSRLYYKGITNARTQDAARSIVDEISNAYKFGDGNITFGFNNNNGSVCIKSQGIRYSYRIESEIKKTPSTIPADQQGYHAIWRDTFNGVNCDPLDLSQPTVTGGGSDGHELLSENMRVAQFDINPPDDNGLTTITVVIITGDNDVLDPNVPNTCLSSYSGSQFCSVSEITTSVQRRI